MKKSVLITITALALIVVVAKSGYAYYENELEKKATQENVSNQNQIFTEKNNLTQVNGQSTRVENYAKQDNFSNRVVYPSNATAQIPDSTSNNSYYSNNMGIEFLLDENGNIIDRTVFEELLDKAVEQGNLSEEDKDYYLSLYDNCLEIYLNTNNAVQDETNTEIAPQNRDFSAFYDNSINFNDFESCH